MRGHYTFTELRDCVALLRQYPSGLRPGELNALLIDRRVIRTRSGGTPAPTTLYHLRRALLKLAILRREGSNLVVNGGSPLVSKLLDVLTLGDALSHPERQIFAEIVLHNSDCKLAFFDCFLLRPGTYDRRAFQTEGVPVIWQSLAENRKRHIKFRHLDGTEAGELHSEVGIQAVLYGIRYWARDELELIDEFFREDIGNLMYPVSEPGAVPHSRIAHAVLNEIARDTEWTVLNVRELLLDHGVRLRVPVKQVLDTIFQIYRQHPDRVALIPTSRSLATFTTASGVREDFELRSYLRDERGRLVSHIRLHRDLREETDE
jgi:hypothetical protein